MSQKKKVHLIGNAHLDPVWLWQKPEGIAEAISTFRVAADFCEEFDGFIFNHNESVLYEWVEENEPELFAKIKKIMLPKDYINYMLTGVHSCDYSDASGMLLLDVENKCWSEEMLRICGITEAMMPKLFESVRFLTTAVSSGMGYADGLYREALFSIALVLFLFIMLINATLNFFLKGEKK